jgi:alpha-tubulin suppressor-like RCC1 family protein
MIASGLGMRLDGDPAEGFLTVRAVFPGGPVARANEAAKMKEEKVVQEGDVLVGVGEQSRLLGLSETDVKQLLEDARSLARINLHFGRPFARAHGREIEPFCVEVGAVAVSGAEEWDGEEAGEIVDIGRKASKKAARAKKAQTTKVKTKPPEGPLGMSRYSQMVENAPPVWKPPPPEYPLEGAATRTPARRHTTSDPSSKVWGCGNNSEGELGLGHRRFIVGPKSVQLPRLPGAHGRRNTNTPHAAATGDGFSIISVGNETAACGTDRSGCLGLDLASGSTAVYFTRIPALSGLAVLAVACGHEHCVLLTKESTQRTFAWGGNTHGQLGLGACDEAHHAVPAPVPTLCGASFSQVAAGRAHTLLLEGDGTAVWSFGAFEQGQLGRVFGAAAQPPFFDENYPGLLWETRSGNLNQVRERERERVRVRVYTYTHHTHTTQMHIRMYVYTYILAPHHRLPPPRSN